MNDLPSACTARESNHVMLDNAVNDMESVVGHAEELLDKINNNSNSPALKNGCDRTEPTLASVLNNSPQMIRDKNAELHELLNKISESLF